MTELLSPPEAARLIGTNIAQVKEWMRRADDPLPSIPVGKSGKFRKVLREQIPAWLAREAGRPQSPSPRSSSSSTLTPARLSVRHIGLVLDHLEAPAPVKLVALILADHCDADGFCWPSYRRIAERSCLSERSVRRHVHELIESRCRHEGAHRPRHDEGRPAPARHQCLPRERRRPGRSALASVHSRRVHSGHA